LILSPDLQQETTILSEDKGRRETFVGDFSAAASGEAWAGSRIEIDGRIANIEIKYNDETPPAANSNTVSVTDHNGSTRRGFRLFRRGKSAG